MRSWRSRGLQLPGGEPSGMDPDLRWDVLGFRCPVPVSATRRALEERTEGVLEVLSDDPETLVDLPLLIGRMRRRLISVRTVHREHRFLIDMAVDA